MDDLIIRKALMKYMRDYKWEFALNSDFSKAIEMVDVQPAVEAVPVVHGEWLYDERKDIIYCNHCNNYALFVWDETSCEISELISDFCPHCGADMRKKV